MIDAAARGEPVDEHRGEQHDMVMSLLEATQREEAFEDVERKDVHALFWSGARVLESAAAERLQARYRDRGWAFPLASIEAQLALASWQDRIDAAWAKLR
jgi:aryl carrier-like protein